MRWIKRVAIALLLITSVLVGVIIATIDYATRNATQTSIQKGLDATALMLARNMPLPQAELDRLGWQTLNAVLAKSEQLIPRSGLKIVPSGKKLTLSVTGEYRTELVRWVGIPTLPVSARSEVEWPLK
jgi:hypothetical protein